MTPPKRPCARHPLFQPKPIRCSRPPHPRGAVDLIGCKGASSPDRRRARSPGRGPRGSMDPPRPRLCPGPPRRARARERAGAGRARAVLARGRPRDRRPGRALGRPRGPGPGRARVGVGALARSSPRRPLGPAPASMGRLWPRPPGALWNHRPSPARSGRAHRPALRPGRLRAGRSRPRSRRARRQRRQARVGAPGPAAPPCPRPALARGPARARPRAPRHRRTPHGIP